MYKNESQCRVLIVGADLSSNGGIASVIKAIFHSYKKKSNGVIIELLKTSHYKDKGYLSELIILIKSIALFLIKIVKYKPHILHIHSSAKISFLRKSIFVVIGFIANIKIILHIHSSQFDTFFINHKGVISWFIGHVLKLADIVVVLCEPWKNKLETKYQLKNVVNIPNPIDLEGSFPIPQEKNMTDDALNIMFIGFLISSKGIEDLIEISRCILKRNINAKIIIAGKGELESLIIKSIQSIRLSSVLEFKGWVEGKEKERLLSVSNLFILPSYNEGMPIAILEAMKYGLPILSTNIAGIPEQVEHGVNGYLLEPGDTEGFCLKIQKLVEDKEKLISMSIQSLSLVKKFDSQIIWNHWAKLYREILI